MPRLGAQTWVPDDERRNQLGSRHRFEVEDLGRHVVTSVDPAHERSDLATGVLFHRADELIVARV